MRLPVLYALHTNALNKMVRMTSIHTARYSKLYCNLYTQYIYSIV